MTDRAGIWKLVACVFAIAAVLATAVAPVGADNPVVAPVADFGVTVELTPYVNIPDGANRSGPRARINQFATAGDRLFIVTDTDGKIYEIERSGTTGQVSLFLDVTAAIRSATNRRLDVTSRLHGGLRSVAFHPDFAANGLFYTTQIESRPANPNPADYLSDVASPILADGVLSEWRYNTATGVVDPASYRQVFRVGMPVYDHPIKQMAFNLFAAPGDDDYGMLYLSHGDGSTQSATVGGGQNNDALGKILRVDPTEANGQQYSVPTDNPFVGDSSMLDEVYAFGFRNPHHLSFAEDDAGRVHLVTAEVGRDNIEEVNLVVAGGNYGWSQREGTFTHRASGGLITGLGPLPANDANNGFIYPAAQYGHDGPVGAGFVGQGIAGGFVIDNGSALSGQYFYSDFPIRGNLYHSSFDDLLGATTTLNPGQAPSALTQAPAGLARILLDHDADPATASVPYSRLLDMFRAAPRYDGSGRADVRFGQGPDGEMYISSKRNGVVYLATNSLSPFASCNGYPRTTDGLVGTEGDDVIVGTGGRDVIDGKGGNDVICGRGGADTINGGSGADIINAGWGSDIVRGGDGDDIVFAGPGLDDVEGEGGDDLIRGGKGGDRLVGNGGDDTIYGGDRKDRLFGFAGNDKLFGGGGEDNLRGGAGNDSATGGPGADLCVTAETLVGCES